MLDFTEEDHLTTLQPELSQDMPIVSDNLQDIEAVKATMKALAQWLPDAEITYVQDKEDVLCS